jgi:hypothetical protein
MRESMDDQNRQVEVLVDAQGNILCGRREDSEGVVYCVCGMVDNELKHPTRTGEVVTWERLDVDKRI